MAQFQASWRHRNPEERQFGNHPAIIRHLEDVPARNLVECRRHTVVNVGSDDPQT